KTSSRCSLFPPSIPYSPSTLNYWRVSVSSTLAERGTEIYNLRPMKLCDYLSPVVAQNLVVITAFLAVLMVGRLVQRRPLFTWRDVVALSLILIWAYYF